MDQLTDRFLRTVQRYAHAIDERATRRLGIRSKDEYAKKRVKHIGGGYNGTAEEFRRVVLAYWEKYGKKPEKYWYDLFCSGKDAYDPQYIPDSIWKWDVLPYFNRKFWCKTYADKGMISRLLPEAKCPDTIVKNMDGYYYDSDGEAIASVDEAIERCKPEEHLIIKPSFSSKGAGILFYDRDDGETTDLKTAFENLRANFVVQRFVRQHPTLEKLNASSLNTIRLISFRFKDEVYILSALLRIGGAGARVDNVSAGGSAVPIRPDGKLYDRSVNRKSEWTTETPNGIKFADICVPSYQRVVEVCKRLHCKLPYLGIVGWDFAVDEAGEPVLIEFNTQPAQNQISCGPTFGDLTDEVLDEVFLKQTLKKIRT